MSTVAARTRTQVRVRGVVQGVGFRPFVYRLAGRERLTGYVLNDEQGVLAEVEGDPEAVERFVAGLSDEAPPLARVDSVSSSVVPLLGGDGFAIRESRRSGDPDALIAPDSATCADCLAELRDPGDRRYRYPFINCTNCGPRFTIVQGVPYDRPLTTMAGFQMCARCQAEYDDPADRRFHAQPNACPQCGPRLRVLDRAGRPVGPPGPAAPPGPGDAISAVSLHLAAGAIVAIKGLGGFHLACDATDELAVSALRARKHREDKPFALMVGTVDDAQALVELGEEERSLLESLQRPIVLAPRCDRRSDVAQAVAPAAPELGLMLPYTPLHHLLMADFAAHPGRRALVMTSGNVSDEPIAYEDEDALTRLAEIADLFLVHDRPIATRTDDSVVRVISDGGRRRALPLRRSRGYVPAPLELPLEARRGILACGAEQKNTFCVARGGRAWVGHHIGDLEQYPVLRAFEAGVAHFERMFAVTPELVVHDLHPGYLSTAYALQREGVELLGVQHHHAHLAACLAEHGETGPAVGAIFDGTGYGTDGTVWGGELLVGGLAGCERVGWLHPVRLPGAAAAIREPWRMAYAWLLAALEHPPELPATLARAVDARTWELLGQVAVNAEVSPVTSSMGRLFDAVGAVCGLCPRVSFEGQAAVELEAAAARSMRPRSYEIRVSPGGVIDPREAVRAIAADVAGGSAVADVAAGFHRAVADVTVRACAGACGRHGLDTVVLSGGVFQNRLLLESTLASLRRAGLRSLTPARLPPNDGGISYGQVAVAVAQDQPAGRLTPPPMSEPGWRAEA